CALQIYTPLPVEIQIAIEPAGVGGGAPSVTEEIEDEGATPVPPADDEPLAAVRSFATAPELEPGSYVLELVPGGASPVRIGVQAGQRPRWRVEGSSQPLGAGELDRPVYDPARAQGTEGGRSALISSAGREAGAQLARRVSNPAREQVTVGGGSWLMSSDDRVAGGAMTAPVDLGNRSSELRSVASAWLPGTHTVSLQRLQRDADADPAGNE